MAKTVLIADDSLFMRTWLRKLLDNSQYEVIGEAKDGIEAIQKCKEYTPDILLLDITMPKINGIEVLKKLHEYNQSTTIIMCSALAQKALMQEALHWGAKDFIIKPYFGDLVSTLQKVEFISQ